MAKALGRKLIVKRDGQPIANLRTKSITINNEPVDVTDDDAAGWRQILSEMGQKEIDISVEGVLANDDLRAEAFETGLLEAHALEFADGAEMAGQFFLANYAEEHAYNEAGTFTAELQSSGVITYTPASS